MYEYHVDIKQHTWASWEDKLRSGWRYNPRLVFLADCTYIQYKQFFTYALSGGIGGRKAHENLSTAGGVGVTVGNCVNYTDDKFSYELCLTFKIVHYCK